MTTWHRSLSEEHTALRPELLEMCWHMRGPSGTVFECAVYRGDVCLELRISCDKEAVSTALLANIEEGRARAAKLKGMVLEKGGFEELAD